MKIEIYNIEDKSLRVAPDKNSTITMYMTNLITNTSEIHCAMQYSEGNTMIAAEHTFTFSQGDNVLSSNDRSPVSKFDMLISSKKAAWFSQAITTFTIEL